MIVMAPTEIDDAEPEVRRVIPDFEGIPFPLLQVYHRELRTSKRIRLVFDLIASGFAEQVSLSLDCSAPLIALILRRNF